MSKLEQPDSFTKKLITAFIIMKYKGHWMDSGTIELDDGTRFSYKIQELKTRKSSPNQQKGM